MNEEGTEGTEVGVDDATAGLPSGSGIPITTEGYLKTSLPLQQRTGPAVHGASTDDRRRTSFCCAT